MVLVCGLDAVGWVFGVDVIIDVWFRVRWLDGFVYRLVVCCFGFDVCFVVFAWLFLPWVIDGFVVGL